MAFKTNSENTTSVPSSPLSLEREEYAASWSTKRVGEWLKDLGFEKYVQIFHENSVDGSVLLMMTEQDLHKYFKIQNFGDLKKIYSKIQIVKDLVSKRTKLEKASISTSTSSFSEEKSSLEAWVKRMMESRILFVTIPKTLFSLCYLTAVAFITSFTMTFVHDRVPDPQNYPPLPDIFLDNIQMIPWAFAAVEYIILFLASLFVLLLLLHKHRLCIFYRFCLITGTIFLLRCLTMYVTALSVPATHLKCSTKLNTTLDEKLTQAWNILTNFGLSIQGVRTCGDYMFSGHTSMLTVMNYFLQEYTPHDWQGFSVMSWALNFSGMFFILAAHEHYSIDVLIAFFISSRLFLYYHSLVHSIALKGASLDRIRSFFPMFSYMETGNEITFANEYEIPWIPIATKFSSSTPSTKRKKN